MRSSERKNLRNRIVKTGVHTEVRKFEVALSEDSKKAEAQLKNVAAAVDKAACKGVISKNAANRRKARAAKQLSKAQAG